VIAGRKTFGARHRLHCIHTRNNFQSGKIRVLWDLRFQQRNRASRFSGLLRKYKLSKDAVLWSLRRPFSGNEWTIESTARLGLLLRERVICYREEQERHAKDAHTQSLPLQQTESKVTLEMIV
jgi:hypothetical protein